MRRKKPNAPATASFVRSSAAEYLTFVAASGAGGVEAVYSDENVWLSQRMMAQLYDVEVPMTMQDWETRLNRFLAATDREVLQDAGRVTAEIAKAHAESEFEKYRIVQDRLFESDFDRVVTETRRLGDGAAKATSRKGEKP